MKGPLPCAATQDPCETESAHDDVRRAPATPRAEKLEPEDLTADGLLGWWWRRVAAVVGKQRVDGVPLCGESPLECGAPGREVVRCGSGIELREACATTGKLGGDRFESPARSLRAASSRSSLRLIAAAVWAASARPSGSASRCVHVSGPGGGSAWSTRCVAAACFHDDGYGEGVGGAFANAQLSSAWVKRGTAPLRGGPLRVGLNCGGLYCGSGLSFRGLDIAWQGPDGQPQMHDGIHAERAEDDQRIAQRIVPERGASMSLSMPANSGPSPTPTMLEENIRMATAMARMRLPTTD